jgi:hypothetical protein
MKLSGLFFALFFTSFNIACSPIYSVSYDYDKNFELVQISTYDWLPIPKEANINNLDAVRIQKAVNAELEAKGLRLISENPDFLIAAHIVTKEKLRSTQRNYPDYYSYWTYRDSMALDYFQYQEGTFILDFVEPFSKNFIWHGAAKVALDYADTPEKRDKLIKEAMQKILQNYPPPSE